MDNIFYCSCGFKCVEGQLAKSAGKCPKCQKGRTDLVSKYGGA